MKKIAWRGDPAVYPALTLELKQLATDHVDIIVSGYKCEYVSIRHCLSLVAIVGTWSDQGIIRMENI